MCPFLCCGPIFVVLSFQPFSQVKKSFGSKILRLIKITSLFHDSFSLTSVFGNSVLVCVCGFFILIRLINNGKSL